jgi:hypothetical protein
MKGNKSNLSVIDCFIRLTDNDRPFEDMSFDDLDSIYRVAFGNWAHHMTREGFIRRLYEERERLNNLSTNK